MTHKLTHFVRKQLAFAALVATSTFAASAATPTPVDQANPKVVGMAAADILSPELVEAAVAKGSMTLENTADLVAAYGYNTDGPMVPAPGASPSASTKVEASKTEPDKNTYLILRNQNGPTPNYNYGTHFLFQGHETGQIGYLTRINLDVADPMHRITLMAYQDTAQKPLPAFDGSTWYPFSQRILLTAENGASGGVWQATLDFPCMVEDISGITGRGGYEGIQADPQGNIIIVEDVGGSNGTQNANAKQPNSFVYRLIPNSPYDLKQGGRLQVLQVTGQSGNPMIFHSGQADADITSADMRAIHTYGVKLATKWITIHDTAKDGFAPFNANAAAKTAGGTPFKRPENGMFRPGTNFTEFVFDETGDTDLRTQAAAFGGFGSLFRLTLSPSSDTGSIQLLYLGDAEHSGFDNVAFWDANHVVFVEDAGDTLHTQRNALDSAWMYDVRVNYGDPNAPQPIRILAQGRDTSATIDSGFSGMTGFQNEGDNEITGWHLSDGDPSVDGLLGAKIPTPFRNGWRLFYTGQHGDNVTYEVFPRPFNEDTYYGFNSMARWLNE